MRQDGVIAVQTMSVHDKNATADVVTVHSVLRIML